MNMNYKYNFLLLIFGFQFERQRARVDVNSRLPHAAGQLAEVAGARPAAFRALYQGELDRDSR